MYRLTSANYLRALFAAAATATATATYSSRRCFADSPPSPATDDFVNVGEKVKIRGDGAAINERKMLPPKLLSDNVAMLTCESSADGRICNVYLVGTRHGSPESRREVKDVIEFVKPEVVFLELCPSRLTVEHKVEGEGCSTVELAGTLHEKPDGYIMEEMRVAASGAESEFTEAYYKAMKYGAKVILGDRPIEITKKRMAANISYWDLFKTVYYIKFQRKSLAAHWETSINPSFEEFFIHERDQYMSAKILEVAREHNSVVIVVGKAHLAGIQKNWKQPVELERLLSLPTEKNPYTQLLLLDSVAAVAVAGAVIVCRILSKK